MQRREFFRRILTGLTALLSGFGLPVPSLAIPAVEASEPVMTLDTSSLIAQRDRMRDAAEKLRNLTLPPILKYVPSHPDADDRGFIALPRINLKAEQDEQDTSIS